MFKELLKLGFEDLGLQELKLRGFVDPMNGIVKDMLIIKNDGNYELQCSDGTFIGFTMEDEIFFGEHFLEIRSNNGDVRRFYKEFRGGLCARFPLTEETLRHLMNRRIDTFHISNDKDDVDIAYFDTELEKSDGLEFHISDNHLIANLNGHYFELLDTKNAEIRVYSF